MSLSPAPRDDTIEVREITAALRRGRRWLVACVLAGLGLALLVNWLGPRRYEATATVVLRDRSDGGTSGMSLGSGALEGVGDLFSLPGQLGSAVETELAILDSRDLLERTITATGLQVRVLSPRGAGVDSLFESAAVDPDVDDDLELRFRRSGEGFDVEGPDGLRATAEAGGTVGVPGAELTLRSRGLPDAFRVELVDRQDLVNEIRLWRKLSVEQEGGDVGSLTFYGQGSRTSARVANTMAALYLDDRRSRTDSLHDERMTLVRGVADSVRSELDAVSDSLRRFQVRAGTFEPERLGDVERAAELRAELDALQIEAGTLDRILARADRDSLSVSDFLAFPSFLQTEAANTLLDQLLTLRAERRELMERRTERDPQVQALTENIEGIEDELTRIARSYRETVNRQLEQIRGELEAYRQLLAARPGMLVDSLVLEKELERIGSSYVGVQAQAVQTRLGHIGENAELRQVDRAVPPKEASFPRPLVNLAVGGAGGLLAGLAAALAAGFLSTRVDDPRRIRTRSGLHAFRLDPERPVLPQGLDEAGCALVMGVDGGEATAAAARSLAAGAALRDGRVALVDLTDGRVPGRAESFGPAGGDDGMERVPVEGGAAYDRRLPVPAGEGDTPSGIRSALRELESGYSLVVVALPGPEEPLTIGLLRPGCPVLLAVAENAPALERIQEVAESLERAGSRVAAVAVVPAQPGP